MNPFNAYREWLELDPALITPNHYQLFGIDAFEDDATKIAHAADKAISKVRSCRPGSYARQWSELLDELTTVKTVLLDKGQKADYDHDLRHAIAQDNTDSGGEPVMHVEGVTHADPNFTRDFYPPNMQAPAQPVPVDRSHAAQGGVTSHETVAPVSQAPYQPVANAQPAANAQSSLASNAAQAPYQPAAAAVAAPAPMATPVPATPAPQQPYQPNVPVAPAGTAVPAAEPSSPFAQPYQPQPTTAPLAQSAAATPQATLPTTAAPLATAPVAAPATAATPAPMAHPAAPLAAGQPAYQPSMTATPATPAASPQVGASRSVASQQRSRGKNAAIALPFIAVGIAAVLLLGGLLYMGLSGKPSDNPVTQATDDTRPPRDVPMDDTPVITRPVLRPPKDDDTPLTIPVPGPNPVANAPAPNTGDVSMPNPFPDTPETDPFDTPDDPTTLPEMSDPPQPQSVPPVTPTTDPPTDDPPKPDVPQPTREELVELGKLLSTARAAISDKDFDLADTQIAKAEGIAKLPAHRGKIVRLKQLNQFTREYWDVVYEALGKYEGGEELPYRDSVIVIVEKSKTDLTIRYKGINKAYPINKLPAGIAMAIADQWFDETEPSNLVFKGAWGFVMPNGSDEEREKALGWWKAALAKGVDIKDFMQIVDDTYDLAAEAAQ